MEIENQETEVEATEEINTEEAPEITEDAESQESVEGAEETPEVEAYQPNLKYSVKDQEYEFDDILKDKITSKEEEEYFRDLLTKTHGLDEIKASRDKFKERAAEYEPIVQEYKQLNSQVDQVFKMAENKDWDAFQQVFKLTDEDILKRAHQLLSYENLTPEQKELHNRQKEQASSVYALEKQNQEYQNQIQTLQEQFEAEKVQQRQNELTSLLNQEGIADKVKAFDQKHGDNAFYQEVVKRGVMHYQFNGKDSTPQELVKEVVSLYGLDSQNPTPSQTTNREKPRVIPNTGSSTATPVARKVKSLDDMRKLAQELED